MTNTTLLKEKMDQSGYKIVYIAEQLKMTQQGIYKKLKDGSEWNYSQVMMLKDILRLSDDDVNNIFFTDEVE